jgi:adenylosuccinate lyase
LAKLQEKGLDRDKAYEMVQRCAMRAWEEKDLDFKTALLQDPEVTKYLSKEELDKIFNVEEFIKNRDVIFERVFGKEALKG